MRSVSGAKRKMRPGGCFRGEDRHPWDERSTFSLSGHCINHGAQSCWPCELPVPYNNPFAHDSCKAPEMKVERSEERSRVIEGRG